MKALALFDFDGTMIRGDSIARLVPYLFFRGLMPFSRLAEVLWKTLLWKLGRYPVEALKSLTLFPLSRLGATRADALLERFVKEKIQPRVYQDALETMRRHREEGRLVLLVSASPRIYLKHLQGFLPADAIIGTLTDGEYRVTVNVLKEEKNRQIEKWLAQNDIRADFADSHAYGDSANDLPMLGMVGHPKLVNPHGKARVLGKGIPHLRWK